MTYSGLKGSLVEPFFSDVNQVFMDIFCLVCRMTLIFFFKRKDMTLDNLPNILNMVIRHIENFLRAFEKEFYFKNTYF